MVGRLREKKNKHNEEIHVNKVKRGGGGGGGVSFDLASNAVVIQLNTVKRL